MRLSATRALASGAVLLLAGCPRAPGPPGPAVPAGEPELRVALAVEVTSVMLGGEGAGAGEMLVSEAGGQPIGTIPPGERWMLVRDSVGPGLRILRPIGAIEIARVARPIVAVNLTEGRFAVADGRRYRGRISVYPAPGGGVTVINRVGFESYVAGVVGPEIGPRRPDEEAAVLAQAVVSRTFALRNRGRWESLGFDAYADTRDQVYDGVVAETPQVWNAVRRTAGEVLRYGRETVDAYFHSTCGARTAAVEEAFGTARGRPYLRPVSDERGRGRYYCDISPRFRWREEWDGPKLRAILTRTLPAVMPVSGDGLQRITDVAVSRATRSGRVAELRIVFERGDVRIPGHLVRTILRPEPGRILHSAFFQVNVEAARDGAEIRRLVATGAGSGHGVGMCQWGAIGRARAGQDYRTILTTYFPGTKIERAY